MAFSQSIGKAQTPAMCQFCEESTEIKWKCINCELFLCQLCSSKIHSKSKASMEHEIINLKDIETVDFANTMRKVDLKNMQCIIHDREKCFVYCKDCSEPACSKCIIMVHQKHEYKALDEVYEGIIAYINEEEDKIESDLQFLKKEKDELQKMLFKGDANFQETKELILQNEREMKEAISKHSKDFLQELEAKWKPSENMINTELSAMGKHEDVLETRKKNLNQVRQSHQAAAIFSTSKTLDKSLPKYSAKKINLNKAKFIPSNMRIRSIMFGDLYTIPDMELIDSYQSEVGNVLCILSSSNNTAFFGSYTYDKLQKIKFENHNIKVQKEVPIAALDMSWTKDEDILLSSRENGLKLYTKDGQLKTFKPFSPLRTLGVHVSRDNKIIIGLAESFPVTYPPKKDSIRRLVVMNQDGDIQHTIEYDRDNQRLITFPYRIITINDKIIVVDLINNEFEGRVVMLDYGGQLHWTYSGCNSINSDQGKFYPRGMAITSTDMIVVSDSDNHAIHVLNHTGEVIVFKDVKSLGIELPLSLNIDKNEVLWIGCDSWRKDKSKKAKIHCVKLI